MNARRSEREKDLAIHFFVLSQRRSATVAQNRSPPMVFPISHPISNILHS
jgi:hypothetical protein